MVNLMAAKDMPHEKKNLLAVAGDWLLKPNPKVVHAGIVTTVNGRRKWSR